MPKKTIYYPIKKETGSLLAYDGYFNDIEVEYVENRVFEETLTFIGYSRGRSSAVFRFQASTGATYQMFMTDMDELLRKRNIINQQVSGRWTYCKRGQNFGIKLAE